MLSEKEQKEITKEFKHYETKQAACIEALKIVQKHRRWVSDDAVKDIAVFLEMSPDEVDSVASFYNLIFRHPVGKNVILLCDSVSCWVMGSTSIGEHIKQKLNIDYGETTEDKRFTLLPIACLGTCDHAPAMMINRETYRDLTPEKIDSILERYR
jgi:NADH-quinone oxidoreductase subunit E